MILIGNNAKNKRKGGGGEGERNEKRVDRQIDNPFSHVKFILSTIKNFLEVHDFQISVSVLGCRAFVRNLFFPPLSWVLLSFCLPPPVFADAKFLQIICIWMMGGGEWWWVVGGKPQCTELNYNAAAKLGLQNRAYYFQILTFTPNNSIFFLG